MPSAGEALGQASWLRHALMVGYRGWHPRLRLLPHVNKWVYCFWHLEGNVNVMKGPVLLPPRAAVSHIVSPWEGNTSGAQDALPPIASFACKKEALPPFSLLQAQ